MDATDRADAVARDLRAALDRTTALADTPVRTTVRRLLTAAAENALDVDWVAAQRCLTAVIHLDEQAAEIARSFARALEFPYAVAEFGRHPDATDPPLVPSDEDTVATKSIRVRYGPASDVVTGARPGDTGVVESAAQAVARQSETELMNEVLAGGAVAASVTAAASVVRAKLEATTQRRKDTLEAETERLRIASEERVARLRARGEEGGEPETGPESA
ncbi:hypothetical protein ACWCXC_07910 [Streptomyces sp. NPDC001515]